MGCSVGLLTLGLACDVAVGFALGLAFGSRAAVDREVGDVWVGGDALGDELLVGSLFAVDVARVLAGVTLCDDVVALDVPVYV